MGEGVWYRPLNYWVYDHEILPDAELYKMQICKKLK